MPLSIICLIVIIFNMHAKIFQDYGKIKYLIRILVVWLRNPADNMFVRCCIAFKASLDGFVNGCRPLIGLDGAFLKETYGGAVLSAISLDGNNRLFPVAIYVTRGETYDS